MTHLDRVDTIPLSRPAAARSRKIEDSLRRAREYLLTQQAPDGHWCGELEGDTILESEYILAMHFLGRGGAEKVGKAAETIRRMQLPAGGWSIYRGGPPEVSASVKAYFVLKLMGDDRDLPHMQTARQRILELGGIEACNTFTKIYLAIFGQYEWARCPAVPPEMILLPRWFPFNIYAMSSWSRTIVVPLSIIWARKPSCPLPAGFQLDELRSPRGAERSSVNAPTTPEGRFWSQFFWLLDRVLKGIEWLSWTPLRKRALLRAEAWIVERLEKSDGLGAIFPPIVNTIYAFLCLGYSPTESALARQIRELEKLEIEDDETLRVQPCFSPVWDTALAMNSLLAAGLPVDDPRLVRAGHWLLDKEIQEVGDWKVNNPDGEVGGWFFEYQNEFYPDCDDTAEVLAVMARLRLGDEAAERRRRRALERGLKWLLSMQNDDGGWAAFDRGCDRAALTYVPFADHNAMIDPSCEDITGRTLEALFELGSGDLSKWRPAVARASEFLKKRQCAEGTWYGRWGCNYIYGSWLAVSGLGCAGEDLSSPRYQRLRKWLRERQNDDGGWGESPLSYDEPDAAGRGVSTAAQTAWALLTLLALGEGESRALARGFEYLTATQREDGSWCDEYWTATGFPRVFYLRYHLYATYFPLLALAKYLEEPGSGRRTRDAEVEKFTEGTRT